MVVHGQVQGVFFRDSCRREAKRRGLTGWVRNRSDGTVEAVFEGEEATVEEMVRWCGEGPPDAGVQDVDVSNEPAEGATSFEVC